MKNNINPKVVVETPKPKKVKKVRDFIKAIFKK